MVTAMKNFVLALVVAMVVVAQVPQGQFPQGPYPQGPVPQGQVPPGQVPQAGDPGDAEHGVARLSLFQGNVSVRHGDAGELTAAAINAPLVATDRVVTGDVGRAEVQFDAMNMIRLGPASEVRLSELQYKSYQVQIAEGTVMFRVLRDNDAQVEISTPTVSLRPLRAGTYRVLVRPDGTTQITVRQGAGEIFGPRGSEPLAAGQTMEARGTPADPEFMIGAGISLDEWDRWNADRDRSFQTVTSNSGRYVNPDVPGTESLDPYGQWQNDPQYGNVWVPQVGPDWAPYQAGRWVYIDYYGWTWVSADPWGWAPYHYGRWFRGGFGWAWWPGPVYGPDYWSPALVGFFGWGGGFGVGVGFGFGFGNVGWVPLAPFEAFRPWYGRGLVGGAGIVNGSVVASFRNARFTNAVTSVRSADFGRGAVQAGNMVRASSADLARGGLIRGAMPFSHSAANGRFSDAAAGTRGAPQTSANRQFYSSRTGVSRTAGATSASTAQGGWQHLNPSTANTGGWRGLNGSSGATSQAQTRGNAPQSTANSQARSYSTPQNGATGQSRGAAPQNPVRINPPIVQNRSSSAPSQARPSSSGGSHAGGGGHGGGGHR
jgi:hypothetical protein